MTVSPGLQLDVLLEVLLAHDVLVVERERDVAAVFLAHDDDVLAVGVLLEAAGHRDQLQHGQLAVQRVGAAP